MRFRGRILPDKKIEILINGNRPITNSTMDVETYRDLARSYGYNTGGDFFDGNDIIADDEHLETMYGYARTMMSPILPIWKSLAQQAVRQWPSPDLQFVLVGDTMLYGTDFSSGRHDMHFAHMTNATAWEQYGDEDDACFLDPRFQGMLLGISSIIPNPFIDMSPEYRLALARDLVQPLYPIGDLVDDDALDRFATGGVSGSVTWNEARSIAVKFMRFWYQVRLIQRAYRERLRLKRSQMIHQVLVPIIVRNKARS